MQVISFMAGNGKIVQYGVKNRADGQAFVKKHEFGKKRKKNLGKKSQKTIALFSDIVYNVVSNS